MHSRLRAVSAGTRGIVAAIAVLAVVLMATGAPANARPNDPWKDVTSEALSNVEKVAQRLLGMGLNAYAVSDYSQSPAGSYTYLVQFIPTDAQRIWKSTCSLTRNGVRIASGTCADLYQADNGLVIPSPGKYVIRVDGKPLWKFTFTIRHPSPPPLAPPPCTIDSVSPGASGADSQVFIIATSGICDHGQWQWWTDWVDNGREMGVFELLPSRKVKVTGVDFSAPVTITFFYLPRGYRQLTAYSLHSEPGVPGFTQVPQTLGY